MASQCVHLHVMRGFSASDVRHVLRPWAADPRRWPAAGIDIVVVDVAHGEAPPLTPVPPHDAAVVRVDMHLASAATLARLTHDDPTLAGLSITILDAVPRAIYLHAGNWRCLPAGCEYADLASYRVALLDHELYHAVLGGGHLACPRPGAVAPIGMQPSKPLAGCLPAGATFRSNDPSFERGVGVGEAAAPLLQVEWGAKRRRRRSGSPTITAGRRARLEDVHGGGDASEPPSGSSTATVPTAAPKASFPSWAALVASRVSAAMGRSQSSARGCPRSRGTTLTDDARLVPLLRALALQKLEAQDYKCAVCGGTLTRIKGDPCAASLDRLRASPCTYLGAAATSRDVRDVNFRWLCVADNVAGRACFMPHAKYAPGIPCTA